VIVPLVARGRSLGTLSLGWPEPGRRPPREEWSLIEALAQRIALAVDNAEQYRERAQIARTLQASLLPRSLPLMAGAEVAAKYVAAGEGIDVGGDFYDVFDVAPGVWSLVIGDVCKGAEAAAVTALARYTLRALAAPDHHPAATLARLNGELLRQARDPRFLSAALCRLTLPPEGAARLQLACGGHPAPVVLRAGGGARALTCGGSLLGVQPGAVAGEAEVELGPGDAIVLYTDGITEADRRRPLTPEGLADALATLAGAEAATVAAAVIAMAEQRRPRAAARRRGRARRARHRSVTDRREATNSDCAASPIGPRSSNSRDAASPAPVGSTRVRASSRTHSPAGTRCRCTVRSVLTNR
jgi:hypothetical protein